MTTPAVHAHTCDRYELGRYVHVASAPCPACDLLELRNAVQRAGIGQGSLDRLAAKIADLEAENAELYEACVLEGVREPR